MRDHTEQTAKTILMDLLDFRNDVSMAVECAYSEGRYADAAELEEQLKAATMAAEIAVSGYVRPRYNFEEESRIARDSTGKAFIYSAFRPVEWDEAMAEYVACR